MPLDLFNAILTQTVNNLTEKQTSHIRSSSGVSRDSSGTLDLPDFSFEKNSSAKFNNQKPTLPVIANTDKSTERFFKLRLPLLFDTIIARLDLTNAKANGLFLNKKKLEELNEEKNKVKKELIAYDSHFQKDVDRKPTEKEKEPIKICYVYYKHLKKSIENFDKREEIWKEERMREIYQRLNVLKSKKVELSGILLNFQHRFEQKNGRKIQHKEDIRPIKDEYDQYKLLKNEIEKLNLELDSLKK